MCKNPQIRWTHHISLSFVLIASNTFFLTSSEVLQTLEPGQEMELKSIEPKKIEHNFCKYHEIFKVILEIFNFTNIPN